MGLPVNPLCPLCKSEKSVQTGQAGSVILYVCRDCSLVFKTTEELDRDCVQELQDGVYTDLRLRTEVQMLYKMAQDRLRDLKKHKSGGKLLEVGCATGEFIELASKQGFVSTGIDASALYADCAKSKGLNVYNGRVEDVLGQDETFDAIVLFHLIEHILDPVAFLETIKTHLKDDGVLFVVCPNLESRSRKVFGFWHGNFQQPDHLTFFSEKTLIAVTQRAGFLVESTFSREYPHSFFTSLRGYLTIRIGTWRKSWKKPESCVENEAPKLRQTSENKKSLYKYLYKQVPYWLGTCLSPLLNPLSKGMEKNMDGHELCLIAKKSHN